MPKPKTEAAKYEATAFRLPQDILQALREGAKAGDRPLNRQVIRILRKGLNMPEAEEVNEDDLVSARGD